MILEMSIGEQQRSRMFEAMTRAVAQKGYARTTVADVVAGAGVSRRTFYEHFKDREDCFLAAYQYGTQHVIVQILDGQTALPPGDWRGRARNALRTYTASLAASPEFARVFVIDVLGAGPKAVELRQQVYDMFLEQFRRLAALAAREEEGIGRISDVALVALVGGIGEIVQRRILGEGAETLEALAPSLGDLAIQVIEAAGATAGARR
jgi:AcrR family transcriptional regulator